MRYLISILIFLLNPVFALANDNLTTAVSMVNANVVFMRHALAPGFGDPSNFSWKIVQRSAIWIVWGDSRLWHLGLNSGAVKPSSQWFFRASGVGAKKQLNYLACKIGQQFLD